MYVLDKGIIHILDGMEQDGWEFIALLTVTYNLKLMNCLVLEFSIEYFCIADDYS